MIKLKIVIAIIIIGILIIIYSFKESNTTDKFYYAYNEKIFLIPSKNKIVIRYNNSKRKEFKNLSLPIFIEEKQIEWQDDSTIVIIAQDRLFRNKLTNEKGWQNDIVSMHPVYKEESGLEMYITDEILVKFYDNVSQKQINEIHKKHNVKVIKSDENYQLIKVSENSDALEISISYQESGLVLFSEPNFISKVELFQIPNDEFFNRQFYLNNTGQIFTDGHWGANDADIDAPEAWTITQGNNNIIVAVIDQGVTPNHPDLPNTRQVRLNNSNLADGDPNNPSATANNNHGNACAGIIAATRNNGEGISGIAPNCRIMPIRICNTDETGIAVDRVAAAINFARQNGAHIISNSWGYGSTNQNLHPAIVEAIRTATTTGRGGLGCLVVFAAGNNARHTVGDTGFVQFPANVNIQGVLTVGASDRDDFQADYSPTSNLIDIVAPSHRAYPPDVYIRQGRTGGIAGETFEVWTIDIPNNTGYNPYPNNPDWVHPPAAGEQLPAAGINFLSYTSRMGGTSAACPQVAGVAALMLSINPNLTQRQVFDILTATADRVGGYIYTNGRSNELGFGRLNAYKAVAQAVAYVSGPAIVCSSGGSFTVNNLPTGATITWSQGPNLARTSAQGSNPCTFSSTGSGSSWVRATLVTSCGSVTLPDKVVWSGTPVISYISGPTYTPNNQWATYYAIPNNPAMGVTDYNWILNPLNGNSVYDYGWTADIAFYNSGFYQVVSRGQNTCGWGDYTVTGIEVYDSKGMSIYPNPASGEVTIEIQSSGDKELTATVWELEIYTPGMILKEKKTSLKDNKTIINTSGWQEGIYMLRVKHGESLLTGKLIIKR
jgi:subtilisin family serine protease